MERLNFSHLYYFYIAAKEGSIKAASEKLHVTQPTISDQIKLLEEFLGEKVFDRKNRGLFLNEEGKVVLEYAERIFDLSQDLTSKIKEKKGIPKKSLDVGITYKMSHYFLYDRLFPLFGRKNTAVNVQEGERHHLIADLESGKIDLVFTHDKETGNRRLHSYNMGVDKTFAVAHQKLAKKLKRFPEGLEVLPYFAYSSGSHFRYEIDMLFNRLGVVPQVVGEGDDINLHQFVIEHSIAFSLLPEGAANRFAKNKNIEILGELPELSTSVWGIIKGTNKGLGYKLLNKKL